MNLYEFMPSDIIKMFKDCGKDEKFIDEFIVNAVLSYIEEKEQELILSLKYNEWVKVDINNAINKVIDYTNKFSMACRGVELAESVKEELRRIFTKNMLIHRILCHVYTKGIFNDGISKFIVIRSIPEHKCLETLKDSKEILVRSRFIEIARNLFFVKQRFPDKTVFESTPLVDRVFAYAEPRLLPLGKIKPNTFYDRELKDLIASLYRTYNEYVLKREISKEEIRVLDEIFREFFEKTFNFLFYWFQARGIKKILYDLIDSIKDNKVIYDVIEAPTGAGKTEIFVLALIIMALVRKLSLVAGDIDTKHTNTPIGIVVYPRRALASNQVDRLLRYVYELNKIVQKKNAKYKPIITISMNYTEVRSLKEYNEASKGLGLQTLKYGVQVEVIEENHEKYVELKHFKCPNGYFPRLRVRDGEVDTSRIFCGKDEINFIRTVKEDVRENPGDIHLTLFETLRNNMLDQRWLKIFGIKGLDGPRIIVLDEIHTYVGITGARYAYLLRRILTRIKHQMNENRRGCVVVGVSATIPNPKEFLRDLFFVSEENVEESIIRIRAEETIPLGNEYFYIIIPTLKYRVTPLAVTIQSVMTIYYNFPPLTINGVKVKKALAFIDNLDVIERARHDLADAIMRRTDSLQRGLQDLRSPCSKLFSLTLRDYAESLEGNRLKLHEVHKLSSWKDGELWWPYSIENMHLGERVNEDVRTIFNKVALFTSHRRERIENAHIILTTSALEVGVDYSGVVLIYQHGMPPNIASLIQRAGRGGRRVIENPLIRTSVAVLLSPEIPSQSALFEIFTRSRSLRDALKYDKLSVSTKNEYIVLQTIAETVLDRMVLNGQNIYARSQFECHDYVRYITSNLDRIANYLKEVIPVINVQDAKRYLKKIISDLQRECRSRR